MNKALSQGIQFLAEQGLNLFAVLDCAALPEDIVEIMAADGVPLEQYTRLVLLGNGSKKFWPAFEAYGRKTADPVDHYSLAMAQAFIKNYLGSPPVLILYPAAYAVPLQRLGTLAGWSHASPLGMGINETYGLWFAYRVAFLTTADLPPLHDQLTQSPCDSCSDKPCISACPANAVRGINAFDISKCVDFRLTTNSVCRDRCLARMACPHAPQHRYPLAQIQYHYICSIEAIRLYHV